MMVTSLTTHIHLLRQRASPMLAVLLYIFFCGLVWHRAVAHQMFHGLDAASFPEAELSALSDFYDSTGGQHWAWRNSSFGNVWNFTGDPNPCTDRWQGVQCEEGITVYTVTSLTLNDYNLTGTLPKSIGQLANLTVLNLAQNTVGGSIPPSIGRMKALTVLGFFDLRLVGSIPPEIATLGNLSILDLSFNYLNGTIPSLAGLPSLTELYLTGNDIDGPIPQDICGLTQLWHIGIEYTNVNGTIPADLGRLASLQRLRLGFNALTGTIPSGLDQARNLTEIYLNNNQLEGSIPEEVCNLAALQHLALENNFLRGALPPSCGGLAGLLSLNLQNNSLEGPLPAEWAGMASLQRLILSDNPLHSSVPAAYGELANLTYLALGNNSLTGPVPDFFAQMQLLQRVDLNSNALKGSFPASLLQVPSLVEIDVSSNLLHGTLPATINQLPRLQYLILNSNSFAGTVPSTFAQLRNLSELMLNSNKLTGSLDSLVDPLAQSQLGVLILDGNTFTGTIPESVFRLKKLNTFVASSNCFHGRLPDNICSNHNVKTLVLDGLSAAAKCSKTPVPSWVQGADTYTLRHGVKGAFPVCLLGLPSLYTLHMSGNMLTGSLPTNVTISPALLFLSLSYNDLTGTIPAVVQDRQFRQLDLSHNRFDGSLLASFRTAPLDDTLITVEAGVTAYFVQLTQLYAEYLGRYVDVQQDLIELAAFLLDKYERAVTTQRIDPRTQQLFLDNNRLSGKVPHSIRDMEHISILGSNLFWCRLDKSDLPEHDGKKDQYECGSRSFDVPYFIWLGCAGAYVLALALVWYRRAMVQAYVDVQERWRKMQRWLLVFSGHVPAEDEGKYRLTNVAVVNKLLDLMVRVTLWTLGFALVLLLPSYSILSFSHSIYLHQYSYTVSGAFLAGMTPVACELVFLLLGLGILIPSLTFFDLWLGEPRHTVHLDRVILEKTMAITERRKRFVNFQIQVLYLCVNTAIVGAVNYGFVRVSIEGQSAAVITAQAALSVFKVCWNGFIAIPVLRFIYHAVSRFYGIDRHFSENKFITLQMIVAIVNNIVIPLLVIAVVSSSCYYDLFRPAEPVTAFYTTEYCAVYSYDLSGCFISRLNLHTTSYQPPFHYTYQCSSSLMTNYAPAFIFGALLSTFVIPGLNVVGYWLHRRAMDQKRTDTYWFKFLDRSLPRILKPFPTDEEALELKQGGTREFTPYFNVNRLLVVVITQYATMLTYGAWFPPVAVAVALSIVVTVYVEKLKVGRFLSAMIDQGFHRYVHVIEIECQELGSLAMLLKRSLWMMLLVKCTFCALFMFDTLGYKEGLDRSYWVLIVVPLLPLLALPRYWIRQWFLRATAPAKSTNAPHFLSAARRDSMVRDMGDSAASRSRPSVVIAAVELGTVSALHSEGDTSGSNGAGKANI